MRYRCDSCQKQWAFPVGKCVFCKGPVTKEMSMTQTVESVTQVNIPSITHPEVPYFVLLLRDQDGKLSFRKSLRRIEVGSALKQEMAAPRRYTIAVVGTGTMGLGIAGAFLKAGHNVIVKTRSKDSMSKAADTLRSRISKSTGQAGLEEAMSRVVLTQDYKGLACADCVIECCPESLPVKIEVLSDLDSHCPPETILASNTSSLSISEISRGLRHPGRVIGMHFFVPVSKMRLVEIVGTEYASQDMIDKAVGIVACIGKEPVVVRDVNGFIVNRLLFLMIGEACRLLEDNIATKEEIDKAMRLGTNHPMGPLETADLIGLDICLRIFENLSREDSTGRYMAPNLLCSLVEGGKLGRKSGEGFYHYGGLHKELGKSH